MFLLIFTNRVVQYEQRIRGINRVTKEFAPLLFLQNMYATPPPTHPESEQRAL